MMEDREGSLREALGTCRMIVSMNDATGSPGWLGWAAAVGQARRALPDTAVDLAGADPAFAVAALVVGAAGAVPSQAEFRALAGRAEGALQGRFTPEPAIDQSLAVEACAAVSAWMEGGREGALWDAAVAKAREAAPGYEEGVRAQGEPPSTRDDRYSSLTVRRVLELAARDRVPDGYLAEMLNKGAGHALEAAGVGNLAP